MLFAEGAAWNGGGEGCEGGWNATAMTHHQKAALVRILTFLESLQLT
jgi:hypothetical protein